MRSGNYLSSRAVGPSTLGVRELNFCVRDGNRWILSAIVTGMVYKRPFGRSYQVSLKVSPFNDVSPRSVSQQILRSCLWRKQNHAFAPRTPFAHTCAHRSSEGPSPAVGLLGDAFCFPLVKFFSQKRISRNFQSP